MHFLRNHFSELLARVLQPVVGNILILMAGQSFAATLTTTTSFDYDIATGRLVKEIVEPGAADLCFVTIYEYDSSGNIKSKTQRNCSGVASAYPGSSATLNQEAAAPASGSAAIFISRSSTDTYTYNPNGSVQVVSLNGENESDTRVYGASHGELIKTADPNNVIVEWVRDNLGRPILEKRSDGTGSRWNYEFCTGVNNGALTCPAVGTVSPAYAVTERPLKGMVLTVGADPASVGQPNGRYTRIYYDQLNREIRSETLGFDGSLIYRDTTYDAAGRVASVTRPYFLGNTKYTTTYQYDKIGRLIKTTEPGNRETSVVYTGLVTTETNALLQSTVVTRNVVGQVISITDANSKTLTKAYDPLGNLKQTTDALGNAVKVLYDVRNRKIAQQDPDLGAWAYKYNALGELVQQQDAKNQTTSLSYDKVGRLTARLDGSLSKAWFYSKRPEGGSCANGIGKLCATKANNDYTKNNSYDVHGRLARTIIFMGADGYDVARTYDDSGRLSTMNSPLFPWSYEYNEQGDLLRVRDNIGQEAIYWQANQKDAEGRLTQFVYGNNVVTTNTYDPETGRLKRSVAGAGTSNTVQDISYTYDALGNLKTRNDARTGVNATYGYDKLNRLETEVRSGGALASPQTITWGYNDIGNITSRSDVGTYAYSASGATSVRPHAVTGVTGTVNGATNPQYTYDANGNLQTVISSGMTGAVTWTSFNMVNAITRTQAGQTHLLGYMYSPDHQRVREVYIKNGVLQRTSTYVDTGLNEGLIYEEDLNSLNGAKSQKSYIRAGNEIVGIMEWAGGPAWKTQYWHKDHLGSPMVLSDANGGVLEQLAYEPYGKRRNANGATDTSGGLTSTNTDRGFTEHEMLDELGLINMNGRIYDPAIGRFLSADPDVPYPDDMQSYGRYSYTRGNPMGATDPTGFADVSCIGGTQGFGGICISISASSSGQFGVSVGGSFGSVPSTPKPAPSPSVAAGSPSQVGGSSTSLSYIGQSLSSGVDYLRLFSSGWFTSAGYRSILDVTYEDANTDAFVRGYEWNKSGQAFGRYVGLLLGAGEDGSPTFGAFGGGVAKGFDGLADLAKFRAGLGLNVGQGTLARLEVNGKAFYGINAHGQPVTMGVNAITRTHAEADVFQQALNAGVKGGNGILYVDRALCAACGQNGGVRTMLRQLGLDQVTVVTPQGTQIIRR